MIGPEIQSSLTFDMVGLVGAKFGLGGNFPKGTGAAYF